MDEVSADACHIHRYALIALEEEREVKALVSQRYSETVNYLRNISPTDRFAVILVNLTIGVDIYILDVTRLDLTEV